MNYEESGKGKATFLRQGGEFVVSVPPPSSVFVILFLTVWMGGWAIGEFTVIQQFLGNSTIVATFAATGFLLVWLVVWTAAGVATAYNLVWMLLGKEIVRLSSNDLLHYNQIGGIRFRSKKYRLGTATDFRPAAAAANKLRGANQPVEYDKSSVVFDYGRKTVVLFPGIDDAEAKFILQQMKMNRPSIRISGQS